MGQLYDGVGQRADPCALVLQGEASLFQGLLLVRRAELLGNRRHPRADLNVSCLFLAPPIIERRLFTEGCPPCFCGVHPISRWTYH